jgi:HEPN domain-containing protein
MKSENKAHYWDIAAGYDYETAKVLLEAKKYFYIGFMCHQTIEKILKALLEKRCEDRAAPFSQNLNLLVKDAGIYEELTEAQRGILDRLEKLYNEAGYPSAKSEMLSELDYERCGEIINETEGLYLWIKKQL